MATRPESVETASAGPREPVRLNLPRLELPMLSIRAAELAPQQTDAAGPSAAASTGAKASSETVAGPAAGRRTPILSRPLQPVTQGATSVPTPPVHDRPAAQSVPIARPLRFQPERITVPKPEPIPLLILAIAAVVVALCAWGGHVAGSAALSALAALVCAGLATAAASARMVQRNVVLPSAGAAAIFSLVALAGVPHGLSGEGMLGAIFVVAIAVPVTGMMLVARRIARRHAPDSLVCAWLAHAGMPVGSTIVVAAAALTALHSFSARLDALITLPLVGLAVAGAIHAAGVATGRLRAHN